MKQLLCCSDSDTGSFNGFFYNYVLCLIAFSHCPFFYGIMGWGFLYVCVHAYMYVCKNVCISLYMYVLCMHFACIIHTYVCMYACIQIQIKFITVPPCAPHDLRQCLQCLRRGAYKVPIVFLCG